MQIWSAEIKEIERLYDSIKGQSPELEKELERLINASDENMVLVYARRCLEVIVTDLCESELKRPRKTEPLQGIIDKLNREVKIPSHIFASMQSLNSLSTFGSHPKEFDPRQVKPVLNNLLTIIEWYLKYKDTKTISKAKTEEAKPDIEKLVDDKELSLKPNKKIIILFSGLLLVVAIVIVLLFVFDIIGVKKQTKELEKSIAVLPFVNDSQDKENTYFINGIMEEVLLNLQTIKDLRVPGRTSVEQYRNVTKSIPEIARELGVNYIVEGSGQKYGNTFRLRIQLLEGTKDRHLWGESYEQVIESPEDIFKIQNRIAESIAAELKAIISPEEKQLINRIHTSNLTAYDFYQRGIEEHTKYLLDNNNWGALEKAEDFYHKALEYDPKYALAYTGLAKVYFNKNWGSEYFSENFLDSILILANIALSYDDQLAEAYDLRGNYYREKGMTDLAIEEYNKSLKYNSSYWETYYDKGMLYLWHLGEIDKAILNLKQASLLHRGSYLTLLLQNIASAYQSTGFMEQAKSYFHESFELNGDTAKYFQNLSLSENFIGNYKKAIEFLKKAYTIDSSNIYVLDNLGFNYMLLGQYKESLKYYKKYLKRLEAFGDLSINVMHRVGYIYWQNGYKKEADYYFDKQLEYCNGIIEVGRRPHQDIDVYYDLAGVYVFRGDKEKAYEYLRIFNQRTRIPLRMVTLLKDDPLFNSLRNEPEFQQIIRDQDAKYQAEHERVRKWLEEQGML
jgi:TolB-like protein/Tfp pilus assembly protein PilF